MINFEQRLTKLKDRRQGSQQRAALERTEKGLVANAYTDYRETESYERLTDSVGVKYAIGSMAPVTPKSTEVSIRAGETVANTLSALLKTKGFKTASRLQGSVPLDVHIEGHSDVDVLMILENGTVLVEGPAVKPYPPAPDPRPIEDQLKEFRLAAEESLVQRYHQSEVDCDNNKSIELKSPSIPRKVDVVPSCWLDTIAYQSTYKAHERGVTIYHKGDHATHSNRPFKHIHAVHEKDGRYSGNLKRVIRLMKNVVADMPDGKKRVAKKLTSYDLAAIGYHMDDELNVLEYFPLALVDKTRTFLATLIHSEEQRNSLVVPDETRRVFDHDNKLQALLILFVEINELAQAIHKQLAPTENEYRSHVLSNRVIIPM